MATIRAYTTVEQSRKLAEILPIESADMVYTLTNGYHTPFIRIETIEEMAEDDVLCWSLAALLKVLPKIGSEEPMIQKLYYANNPTERYICQYSLTNMTGEYNNPVDACVEMILKLNEFNLL